MKKEYRMLSWVERWAIAPRHHHQDVANHSFYVTLYASEICQMLKIGVSDRASVMDAALRHDASEAWSSDVPGPAKRSLFDEDKHIAYKAKFAESMNDLYLASMADMDSLVYSYLGDTYRVRDIVKVADLIDEVFFLAFERNLGNNLVKDLYQREMNRLDQAAVALAGDKFAGDLMGIIGTEIARIGEEGAVIPVNDSDLTPGLEIPANDMPFPDV